MFKFFVCDKVFNTHCKKSDISDLTVVKILHVINVLFILTKGIILSDMHNRNID